MHVVVTDFDIPSTFMCRREERENMKYPPIRRKTFEKFYLYHYH